MFKTYAVAPPKTTITSAIRREWLSNIKEVQEGAYMKPLFTTSSKGKIQKLTGLISWKFLARTHSCSEEDIGWFDQAIFLSYISMSEKNRS